MESKIKIHIIERGAATPLGIDSLTTAANAQKGLGCLLKHPWITNSDDESVKMGIASWIEDEKEGEERFEELLTPAFLEAVKPLENIELKEKPLFIALGLPERGDNILANQLESLLKKEAQKLKINSLISTFPNGNTAGLIGLKEAIKKIELGEVDFAVIGGVESMNNIETVNLLEETNRLRGASNPFGVIPGEAAGFYLICSEDALFKYRLHSKAEILALGEGLEKDKLNKAKALNKAILGALKPLAATKISNVFCDRNSERSGAEEHGFSILGLTDYLKDPAGFNSFNGCWGDVGAATVSLLINQALFKIESAQSKEPQALIWVGSDKGERLALSLKVNLENIDPALAKLKAAFNFKGGKN